MEFFIGFCKIMVYAGGIVFWIGAVIIYYILGEYIISEFEKEIHKQDAARTGK